MGPRAASFATGEVLTLTGSRDWQSESSEVPKKAGRAFGATGSAGGSVSSRRKLCFGERDGEEHGEQMGVLARCWDVSGSCFS